MKDSRLPEEAIEKMPTMDIDYGEAMVEGINGQSSSINDEIPTLDDVVERSTGSDGEISSPSTTENTTTPEQNRSSNSR